MGHVHFVYNPLWMRRQKEKIVSRTILVAGSGMLALWALFSPAFGPVMDHHFAERHHNHSHIYLGLPDVDHLHPYQDSHSHRMINQPIDSNHIDTVFLTPLDGLGQDSPASLTPAAQPINSHSDQGDSSLLLAWPRRIVPLEEAYVPLSKKPPRA